MKSRLKKILEIKKRIETNSETAACEETQCWDGWKKKGTKLKGGRLVNNCVKESGLLGRYLLNKKNYDLAADTLSSLMKRKTERRHSVEYYAAMVASNHTGVNTRDLVSHYKSKNNIKESEYNDTEQKNDMAHTQLHFISYASDKIMNLIMSGVKIEEWYQNKLSKVHSEMESLYAYMEGTSRKNTMGATEEDIDYITGCPLLERLNPNDGMGTYIRDFSKSDAPQFKGASSPQRRKMAIAAYLGAKRKKLEK